MRVLKIIHGYPPRYNAGSEVYSQTLCAELCKRNEVHVFTREENPFVADGVVRESRDSLFPNINLHIVNAARVGINYKNRAVDRALAETADKIKPDVAHIGHLHHLSTGIADELAKREIPFVFTLHDFWLMCLRGQFIQLSPSETGEVFPLCDGQENKKCADRCLRRFCGDDSESVDNWEKWVGGRMTAMRRAAELTDIFIAPSKHLARRFCEQFPLPPQKVEYLDYGFNLQRLTGRRRVAGKNFVFGYIGTHIPGKGVRCLLDAFNILAREKKNCELHIWGRPTTTTDYLKSVAAKMPVQKRIRWRGEYINADIVGDVFNRVDAVVAPSIWEENSPLVIHEAQQAKVPVIAADMGGMAEYVCNEKNGLLFSPRDADSLSMQMGRFVDDPRWAKKLGARGYPFNKSGDVCDIESHARTIESLYRRAIRAKKNARIKMSAAPWRITFDTNPDHCNYHCTMCEEHSPYSPLQFLRRADKTAKRVMSFNLIARNVEKMAKNGLREIIPSTMGEPLLYKNFEDIIALCKKTGVMLNLTTNGSFPRLGAEKWAKLLTPVTSDIKISWNGARKKTHEAIMKNASWQTMLDNARALVAVRDAHFASGKNYCRLTFQMTFMESNYKELPDLIRLAAKLGIDRVKGHHLWAHFSEIKNEDMRRDADAVRRWNDVVDKSCRAAKKYPRRDGKTVLLENIEKITYDGGRFANGRCPFLGKEAWVNARGDFNPCCAPDAERKTLGEFGNLHETDLSDIWNGDAYRLLTKSYRTRAVCQKCNMRGIA